MATKYYIDLNGIYTDVVDNWNECENIRLVKKLKVNFKSFKTLNEAKEALNHVLGAGNTSEKIVPDKKPNTRQVSDSNHGIIEFWEYESTDGDYLIFTDGGCDKNQAGAPVSDYGYSAIVTKVVNKKLVVEEILGGIIPLECNEVLDKDEITKYEDTVRQANITGELHAARLAYSYCVAKKIKNFYIVCDYMGVGYFCTGYYKNNLQPQSKSFKQYYDILTGENGPVSEIKFIHTPSHMVGMNPEAQKYRKMVLSADSKGRKAFIYNNATLLAGNYNADDLAGVLKSGEFELADTVTESAKEVVEFYNENNMQAVDYKKYVLTNAFVYTNLEDIPHGQSGFWNDYSLMKYN